MRLLLFIVLWGSIASTSLWSAEGSSPDAALRRAVQYLWNQQQSDGSWRSPQYAVLRSGQALTPFVLHTLLESLEALSAEDAGRARQAVAFIESHIDSQGALGKADPDVLEYPVYSTAYAVLALQRLQSFRHLLGKECDEDIRRMQEFLTAAQFEEVDGFTAEMPAYGGWGFDRAKAPGESGHMDLAHTRRALQALSTRNQFLRIPPEFGSLAERAQAFLRLLQKDPAASAEQPAPEGVSALANSPGDGGFYFSPVVLTANKGRFDESTHGWRSYASATCDGLLALLAANVPREDQRVVAAAHWLREHPDCDYPQGVPTDHPEPWGEAIRFYHYAARAEAYRALGFPKEDRLALATAVARHQRPDGSFVNEASPLMKEDDPLLCTALAVVALTHGLSTDY